MAQGTAPRPDSYVVNFTTFSPGVTSGNGAQIPSDYLTSRYNFIFICIRRYGYFDSVVFPRTMINQGVASQGTKRYYNGNLIDIKVNNSGLITISGTNASDLTVDVYAF